MSDFERTVWFMVDHTVMAWQERTVSGAAWEGKVDC